MTKNLWQTFPPPFCTPNGLTCSSCTPSQFRTAKLKIWFVVVPFAGWIYANPSNHGQCDNAGLNDLLLSGELPPTWQKTVFQMLPKTAKAMVTSDYRPIANIRVLYKLFTYLVLGRIENTLDCAQPEEQHGFRKNRRIEEHLVTANYVFDKTMLVGTPLWLISLDLSKAFDRVDWQALWTALETHGVSQHLVWILQLLYDNQRGQVLTDSGESREFDIRRGVRQGCVLSPRLFCSVLEWALSKWRMRVRTEGIDLEDGGQPLLDLRFAGDILVFATSSQQAAYLLDELVVALADVGLILNQDKTKLITTQTQPPTTITTPGGLTVAVVDQDGCHKWLGCILSGNNRGSHRLDLEYHLQAASKTFFANRNILCNKSVSLVKRLQFFDKIVTPVACFAAGHRKIYKTDLETMDVHFRRLLRSVVGPPSQTNWLNPWHEILHDWNARVARYVQETGTGVLTWSRRSLQQYWHLCSYIAGLPDVRWVSRTVAWRPRNISKRGAPFRMWHSAAETFCRWKGIANWQAAAMNTQDWYKHTSDFVPSSSRAEAGYVRFQLCKCLCLKWATRANAPLVYRFHSLTLVVKISQISSIIATSCAFSFPIGLDHRSYIAHWKPYFVTVFDYVGPQISKDGAHDWTNMATQQFINIAFVGCWL